MNTVVVLFHLQLQMKPGHTLFIYIGKEMLCGFRWLNYLHVPLCSFTYCKREGKQTSKMNKVLTERWERNHQG